MPKLIDLQRQMFGRLTVLHQAGRNSYGYVLWLCSCTCGREVTVSGQQLKAGHTNSCGCYRRERMAMLTRLDLMGQVFGRLTVIASTDKRDGTSQVWVCRCVCGALHKVRGSHLTDGNVTSCGCYQREVSSRVHLLHGQHASGIYHTWEGMRQRCLNPRTKGARYYLQKGITIEPLWEDFRTFSQDMAETWFPHAELHRRDSAGPYSKENCLWLTKSAHSLLHWQLRKQKAELQPLA